VNGTGGEELVAENEPQLYRMCANTAFFYPRHKNAFVDMTVTAVNDGTAEVRVSESSAIIRRIAENNRLRDNG